MDLLREGKVKLEVHESGLRLLGLLASQHPEARVQRHNRKLRGEMWGEDASTGRRVSKIDRIGTEGLGGMEGEGKHSFCLTQRRRRRCKSPPSGAHSPVTQKKWHSKASDDVKKAPLTELKLMEGGEG